MTDTYTDREMAPPADDSNHLRRALERIRDYQAADPEDLNEWTEAAAFHEVKRLAAEALQAAERAR